MHFPYNYYIHIKHAPKQTHTGVLVTSAVQTLKSQF